MLAVAGLSCARGPRTLFRDLSFVAEAGTYVQVTGSNGSGKTTLLRTLAGLSLPVSGSIRWQGEGELAACRAYIGHAQGFKDPLSVTENLLLAWQLDAERAADESDAVSGALERVGLTRQRNLPVMRLSQGQRKRLHLARLTRSTRALWLLDEPSASLDAAGHDLLDALVSAHLAAGGIAVIATHETLGIVARVTQQLVLNG
jgi:heme exporter protein A